MKGIGLEFQASSKEFKEHFGGFPGSIPNAASDRSRIYSSGALCKFSGKGFFFIFRTRRKPRAEGTRRDLPGSARASVARGLRISPPARTFVFVRESNFYGAVQFTNRRPTFSTLPNAAGNSPVFRTVPSGERAPNSPMVER